jgi:hypothetical protein
MFLKVYLLFFNLISFNIVTDGLKFNILNNCNYRVPIYSHENNKFINKCNLQNLEKCTIEYERLESGLIKTTQSENATLFEFTINNMGIFYDISVVPPGCGICYSYDECFNISKKTSFNIPLSIMADMEDKQESCKNLECLENKCNDAYLYPYDDLKTNFCKVKTNNGSINDIFNIIYCPKNNNQNNLQCN